MKSHEIKIGHIYYVYFNPAKKGEFPDKHLAVVLKKNADKITFVTIPLTSKENGLGVNKMALGKLDCLPSNLRNDESYAVLDQIRTVSSERFAALMDDGKPYDAELPHNLLKKLRKEIIKDFLFPVSKDEQNSILIEILHGNMAGVDELN